MTSRREVTSINSIQGIASKLAPPDFTRWALQDGLLHG